MPRQAVLRHNAHPHLVGHQHDVRRTALTGGNQHANFVINSLFHGGVIPAVGVAVAAEREQQVGDHGGDAFQQNRLRWGDSRGDQFIKLLPALGGAPVGGPAVAMMLDPCGHLVVKDLRGGDI